MVARKQNAQEKLIKQKKKQTNKKDANKQKHKRILKQKQIKLKIFYYSATCHKKILYV